MGYHVHKDEVRLAWLDNRDTANLQLKIIMRRVQDAVLTELEDEFLAAIHDNKIPEFAPDMTGLRALVAKHANHLADGK